MTPTHKEIYKRLKKLFPKADHYSIHLDYTIHKSGNESTDIYLHIGDLFVPLQNFAELEAWFNNRGSYRKTNEILFRRFAI